MQACSPESQIDVMEPAVQDSVIPFADALRQGRFTPAALVHLRSKGFEVDAEQFGPRGGSRGSRRGKGDRGGSFARSLRPGSLRQPRQNEPLRAFNALWLPLLILFLSLFCFSIM